MCVSTIWGRYHYVADVFAGMITGTLGYVIGKWLMERRQPEQESTEERLRPEERRMGAVAFQEGTD